MTTEEEPAIDAQETHELLEIVKRLKEVRRRFVRNASLGDRFDHAEASLDSVILDLDGWLKPGGRPVDLEDLGLRLAVVEDMIEGLGFPGYSHVLESVRETLATLAPDEHSIPEEDPPAPQRFQPPPSAARPVRRSRAPAARPATKKPAGRIRWGYGLLAVVVVIAGCMAGALALGVFSIDELIGVFEAAPEQIAVDEPVSLESPPVPVDTSALDPSSADKSFREAAQNLGQLVNEIEAAETAMNDLNLDSAMEHLAAAAAIDRHHRGVVSLAESLIRNLLRSADRAFDRTEWELAAKRLEDARHLARGLYLDTAAIDQMARKHAAMTRFVDITPDDQAAIQRAVGRFVRITLTTKKELFGRIEAHEDNRLNLSIHSGVDGGGVQFSMKVKLDEIREIRVYEATEVSETVLGR